MTVNEAFQKLKSNLELNSTFNAAVIQKHGAVRSALRNIDKAMETRLIGSLGRRTRIQPRQNDSFDIDILVVFGEFFKWLPVGAGISPADAIGRLSSIVGRSDRYSGMNPAADSPTVTFEYRDNIKVELVPAYRDQIGQSPNGTLHQPKGRAYWIPKSGVWILADYDYDGDYVSAANTQADQWLIPTIKMLKALRRLYFQALSSFHLEVIAAHILTAWIQALKSQHLAISFPLLIEYFFQHAGSYLNVGTFPGSNTPAIVLPIPEQQAVITVFGQVYAVCTSIGRLPNDNAKITAWRNLFGDVFPAA